MQEEKYDWECVYNHLPKWVKDYEDELDAVIGSTNIVANLGADLDRYNYLTKQEEKYSNDPFFIYGYEHEKEEIINRIVAYYTPYRQEAEELRKTCKLNKFYGNSKD